MSGFSVLLVRMCRCVVLAGCVGVAASAVASTKVTFVAPTPEELAMKSVPGHPGLPAVVLNREEVTQDAEGRILRYSRIKVLTDEGRDYANVVLSFVHGRDNRKITDIQGRTIQPDGTITVFSGQPYQTVLEKRRKSKLQQTVFTLPDVRVGSILEYSYIEQFSNFVDPPKWDVQGELFVMREHFVWNPVKVVRGEHAALTKVAFYDILPPGVSVQTEKKSYTGVFDLGNHKQDTYELTATDLPPTPEESFTPPMSSLEYSVRFVYTHSDQDKYWGEEGKYWSKDIDHYLRKNDRLDAATREIMGDAKTEEEKLRRIYAAVMALENAEFTRDHTQSENKANEHAQVKEANDVLELKRGTPVGLTILFLAMARSAGMEAYAMYVPDRTEAVFAPQWLSFGQFSDLLAVVKVDGKERFFDPGSRGCAFGHLGWWHEDVQGVRQTANGVVLERTPSGNIADNVTRRRAELRVSADGSAAGTMELSYTGAAALHWRRAAFRNDDQGFRHAMEESLQSLLPAGATVEITAMDHVLDYEDPLTVHVRVSGLHADAAGKRLLLPMDIFSGKETSPFPEKLRVYPIDFRYPERVEDNVTVTLPTQMTIETLPPPASFEVRKDGSYAMSVSAAKEGFAAHREFVFKAVFMQASEHAELHDFFAKISAQDHEQVVLTVAR